MILLNALLIMIPLFAIGCLVSFKPASADYPGGGYPGNTGGSNSGYPGSTGGLNTNGTNTNEPVDVNGMSNNFGGTNSGTNTGGNGTGAGGSNTGYPGNTGGTNTGSSTGCPGGTNTGNGTNTGGISTSTGSPTGLLALGVSTSQINLTWAAYTYATGYQIQRSLDGVTGWTQIGTSVANSYSDTASLPARSTITPCPPRCPRAARPSAIRPTPSPWPSRPPA